MTGRYKLVAFVMAWVWFSQASVTANYVQDVYMPSHLRVLYPQVYPASYNFVSEPGKAVTCLVDIGLWGKPESGFRVSAMGLGFELPKPFPDQYPDRSRRCSANFFVHMPRGANGLGFSVKEPSSSDATPYTLIANVYGDSNDISMAATTEYLQIDPTWSEVEYGIDSGKTIKQVGCCLCCAASMVNDLLRITGWSIPITPDLLNSWLQDTKGYVSKTLVDHNAVCSVVNNQLKAMGANFRVVYRRNLGVSQSLIMGYPVMTTVRGGSHFVRPYNFIMQAGKPKRTGIMDPMNRQSILENYEGVSTTNTRTYYLRYTLEAEKKKKTSTASVASVELAGYPEDATTGVSYGNSALYVADTSGKLSISAVHRESGDRFSAEAERLEDESAGELVASASVLDIAGAAPGTYDLTFSGPPGQYSVLVRKYDYDSTFTESVESVIIGASGVATQSVTLQSSALFVGTLNGLRNLPHGTYVEVMKVFVQAIGPGKLWIGAQDRSPSIVASTSTYIPPGSKLKSIRGILVKPSGDEPYILMDGIFVEGLDTSLLKPCFVVPEKASMARNVYIKTLGKVTSIEAAYYTLNGVLKVSRNAYFPPVPELVMVGDWVEAEGFYYGDGLSYVNYLRKVSSQLQ